MRGALTRLASLWGAHKPCYVVYCLCIPCQLLRMPLSPLRHRKMWLEEATWSALAIRRTLLGGVGRLYPEALSSLREVSIESTVADAPALAPA